MPDPTLDAFTRDFTRLQQQKARPRGGVEQRILTNLAMYYGEHYVRTSAYSLLTPTLDKNKLALVFNLIRKHTRRKIGRLASPLYEFGAKPDHLDPRAFAQAEVVDKLVRALDHKVKQSMRTWEILKWLVIGGVAVEHSPWVPDAATEPAPAVDPETGEPVWRDHETNEPVPFSQVQALVSQGRSPESFSLIEELQLTGDVGSVIYSPLAVFVDAAVRSLDDLASDQAVYLADIKTKGWIAQHFGADAAEQAAGKTSTFQIVKTQLQQLGPALSGTNLRDLMPAIAGSKGQDDPDMAIVLTRYQPPHDEFPSGRETFFVPGRIILDDRPNPYESAPLVDYHYDPTDTSFWSGDFVTDLVPGQKFLNKRMSQLGEQSNASIYDLVLLGPELTAADIPSDYPGFVENGIDERGNPQVARLPGPSLPGWFLDSIQLVIDFLSEAGSADLIQLQQRMSSQRRGSLDIPLMQELLDSEDGPLHMHLGERFAAAKQMRVNRVKQFYPPIRTLNYAGASLRDETLVFHTSHVLRAGTEFTITVEPSSVQPELFALRESRVRDHLNSPLAILYVNPRTGALDPQRIAAALKHGRTPDERDKETQARKLAGERIAKLWRGEPLTEPLPFYPHEIFMDELEAAMLSTEWEGASPELKQAFIEQWNAHRAFLEQAAQQAQQAVMGQMFQSTMAQAAQQAASKAAADATDTALDQVREQQRLEEGQPTVDLVRAQLANTQARDEAPPTGQPPA